jgi:protein-L-isoaspartate O-methyltransferase
MVIPVGDAWAVQQLYLIRKNNNKIRKEMMTYVRFVPFTRE